MVAPLYAFDDGHLISSCLGNTWNKIHKRIYSVSAESSRVHAASARFLSQSFVAQSLKEYSDRVSTDPKHFNLNG